jgi:hypothetical protein
MLVRRAYAAPVIWSALAARARGMGYRRIALRMRLPETTVRDWLRAFRRTEPRLLDQLTRPEEARAWAVLARLEPGRLSGARAPRNTSPPHPAGTPPSAQPP